MTERKDVWRLRSREERARLTEYYKRDPFPRLGEPDWVRLTREHWERVERVERFLSEGGRKG